MLIKVLLLLLDNIMPEPSVNTQLGGFFQWAWIPLPRYEGSLSKQESEPCQRGCVSMVIPCEHQQNVKGNPLTTGIYSLLIPNSEEEIQQVSYFQSSQTFVTILACKGLHQCRAVESQDTGFEKEQVKMQDVIPKSNYILHLHLPNYKHSLSTRLICSDLIA